MGLTADCEVEIDGKPDHGQVLLETTELVFRGAARLRIPFRAMKKVSADAGVLSIAWRPQPGGKAPRTLTVPLGARAERWADKIKNPPGRLDKLGVKAGMKVALWGEIDPAIRAEIAARAEVTIGKPRGGEALIFVAVETPGDVGHIVAAAERMAPDGAVWVVRRKGPSARVTEADSMAAGRAAGLVDTKVVAFSDSHTAERYVIPVSARKAAAGKKPAAARVRSAK